MSSIKDKRKKNNNNKLSGYFQDVKIVICQESDVTFEKTIQFKTKDDNEKIFSHKFNENNVVDYTALVEKK